jgi:primosomal protein N' (replication factor Y)
MDLAGLRRLDQAGLAGLGRHWLEGRVRLVRNVTAEARQVVYVLAKDPPWPVRPSARRQLDVLDRLYDGGPASRAALAGSFGPGIGPVLVRLMDAGLVAERRPDEFDAADGDDGGAACGNDLQAGNGFALTAEQAAALGPLLDGLGTGGVRLLHGVTGSGKTAVYLELARACLARGRSALLLAPEVALACALRTAAGRFFTDREVVLFHGYQSPRRREETFRALAAAAGPALVVGTRSALFLPVRDLGLIVLDEEHDTSFKQDERFVYQAKEVAFFRARQSGGLLVLGSATPDVKTFHASESGQVERLSMPSRVGESRLPAVRLVDLLAGQDRDQPLAPETADRLREVVAAGDQAIIMLNRRGYAPLMYCLECGDAVRCPHCQVGLTYHKLRERLICHYCGLMRNFPLVCPKCGSSSYIPMGLGAEGLEERLRELLPRDAAILRLDRDSARRQERLEEILRDFAAGKAQVLVGTQMLSKGHHFPGVTLVAVADGDMGLNLPDYRASERTFQLLVQVSGRAGRGDKPGEVLIQTRNPGHPFWRFVLAGDYRGFYDREIELRRKFNYPPFVKLGLLRLSHPAGWDEAEAALAAFGRTMRQLAPGLGVRALGPAPAPLSQLRGRRRFHCLLKAPDWPSIRTLYARLEEQVPRHGKLRLALDLDPVDML